ncbi:MAG: ATP-binding cassette domain-containing protein, partial [Muribaculaceae bacterium]|nr:ATP-binding cassette domain-containing protein [Muribaculaceae bacterium]
MGKVIDYNKVEIERADRLVMKDVTFSVEEGEFCYLVGKVGSGKSSLMKTMYADVRIANGEKAEVLGYD